MSKLILLVEDNPSDEKLTLLAFKRSGIANDIHVVRDGAEALAFLFSGPEPAAKDVPFPVLVLLDLHLPKIDGFEVLRRIRANPVTRRLPVVILTSSREEEDVVRGYEAGANAYVRKPVDFVAFCEAARTLGLFWLLLNETAPLPVKIEP